MRRPAQAMARMPAATRLVVDDDQYRVPSHLGPLVLATVGAEHLKSIHGPATALDLCHPPIYLIINLPAAVYQAGVALTCLRLLNLQLPQYVPAWDSGVPYMRPLKLSGRNELREACWALQVLKVTSGST
ncbi:hypothetical protein PspLS_11055 [Pyricularia sp. CBS 133598]|nr:hypothetical protein PspLS_11055 [Pyricularia sp. CBS 133598]